VRARKDLALGAGANMSVVAKTARLSHQAMLDRFRHVASAAAVAMTRRSRSHVAVKYEEGTPEAAPAASVAAAAATPAAADASAASRKRKQAAGDDAESVVGVKKEARVETEIGVGDGGATASSSDVGDGATPVPALSKSRSKGGPPALWRTHYDNIVTMRAGKTAPVDREGCHVRLWCRRSCLYIQLHLHLCVVAVLRCESQVLCPLLPSSVCVCALSRCLRIQRRRPLYTASKCLSR
jgi:hypothetical protein